MLKAGDPDPVRSALPSYSPNTSYPPKQVCQMAKNRDKSGMLAWLKVKQREYREGERGWEPKGKSSSTWQPP